MWVLWKITVWTWTLCMVERWLYGPSGWVETDVNHWWGKPKGSQVSVFLLLMELLAFLHTQGLVLPNLCCPNLLSKTLLSMSYFLCVSQLLVNWIDLHSMPVKIRSSIINKFYTCEIVLHRNWGYRCWDCAFSIGNQLQILLSFSENIMFNTQFQWNFHAQKHL